VADDLAAEPPLDAGAFTAWLAGMEGALRGERSSDVPCGGCTACCSSHQFVLIEPDEAETLAHVPAPLLFPAPGRPEGHVLLGYDERGRCPMLGDDGCSIYAHRPRACRTYDCRVLAAAGVDVEEDQPLVARRARRWRFSHPTEVDRIEHEAVRAAAAFLASRPEVFSEGRAAHGSDLAALAVDAHDAFITAESGSAGRVVSDPEPKTVRVHLRLRRG
jgi:Fe-S-cluster containining protein